MGPVRCSRLGRLAWFSQPTLAQRMARSPRHWKTALRLDLLPHAGNNDADLVPFYGPRARAQLAAGARGGHSDTRCSTTALSNGTVAQRRAAWASTCGRSFARLQAFRVVLSGAEVSGRLDINGFSPDWLPEALRFVDH